MRNGLVRVLAVSAPATDGKPGLPMLVERAGGGGTLRLGRILLC
jgi:hypothetical protein